jgi:hypothetical protein
MSGARAYSLKALTICFIASTCATMVCVARSRICASCAIHAAQELAPHALRGQLDRRQRILDLVRQAARHLAPGRVALRLQQRGDVVEHQHHAGRAAQVVRQRGAGAHEHALAGVGQQFDLLAPIQMLAPSAP